MQFKRIIILSAILCAFAFTSYAQDYNINDLPLDFESATVVNASSSHPTVDNFDPALLPLWSFTTTENHVYTTLRIPLTEPITFHIGDSVTCEYHNNTNTDIHPYISMYRVGNIHDTLGKSFSNRGDGVYGTWNDYGEYVLTSLNFTYTHTYGNPKDMSFDLNAIFGLEDPSTAGLSRVAYIDIPAGYAVQLDLKGLSQFTIHNTHQDASILGGRTTISSGFYSKFGIAHSDTPLTQYDVNSLFNNFDSQVYFKTEARDVLARPTFVSFQDTYNVIDRYEYLIYPKWTGTGIGVGDKNVNTGSIRVYFSTPVYTRLVWIDNYRGTFTVDNNIGNDDNPVIYDSNTSSWIDTGDNGTIFSPNTYLDARGDNAYFTDLQDYVRDGNTSIGNIFKSSTDSIRGITQDGNLFFLELRSFWDWLPNEISALFISVVSVILVIGIVKALL